jgi:hypothetical protein
MGSAGSGTSESMSELLLLLDASLLTASRVAGAVLFLRPWPCRSQSRPSIFNTYFTLQRSFVLFDFPVYPSLPFSGDLLEPTSYRFWYLHPMQKRKNNAVAYLTTSHNLPTYVKNVTIQPVRRSTNSSNRPIRISKDENVMLGREAAF